MIIIKRVNCLANSFSFFWIGVSSLSISDREVAILPNSVLTPVDVTNPFPEPFVVVVPLYSIFFLSAKGVSWGKIMTLFRTDSDSPVKIASLTLIS